MFDKDLKVYKLFISHISKEDDEYDLFLDKLAASHHLEWKNYAIMGQTLPEELIEQMEPVDVVIILSGLCSKDAEIMARQRDMAIKLRKPIVVIRPYGLENVPSPWKKSPLRWLVGTLRA